MKNTETILQNHQKHHKENKNNCTKTIRRYFDGNSSTIGGVCG